MLAWPSHLLGTRHPTCYPPALPPAAAAAAAAAVTIKLIPLWPCHPPPLSLFPSPSSHHSLQSSHLFKMSLRGWSQTAVPSWCRRWAASGTVGGKGEGGTGWREDVELSFHQAELPLPQLFLLPLLPVLPAPLFLTSISTQPAFLFRNGAASHGYQPAET